MDKHFQAQSLDWKLFLWRSVDVPAAVADEDADGNDDDDADGNDGDDANGNDDDDVNDDDDANDNDDDAWSRLTVIPGWNTEMRTMMMIVWVIRVGDDDAGGGGDDDDDCVSHPCWPLPALPRAFLASLNNAPMVMVVMMMAVMMMMVVMVMVVVRQHQITTKSLITNGALNFFCLKMFQSFSFQLY